MQGKAALRIGRIAGWSVVKAWDDSVDGAWVARHGVFAMSDLAVSDPGRLDLDRLAADPPDC